MITRGPVSPIALSNRFRNVAPLEIRHITRRLGDFTEMIKQLLVTLPLYTSLGKHDTVLLDAAQERRADT